MVVYFWFVLFMNIEVSNIFYVFLFVWFGFFLWWKVKDLVRNILMLGYFDKVFDLIKILFENCRKSCLKFCFYI